MNDVVCKHGWSRRFCEPCSSAHIISQLKEPRDMGMLAIKPENVPDAVWHTAMSTYHKAIKKRPGSAWQEAIAAALNAWPGAYKSDPALFGADEVQRLRINEASFRRHTTKTERWRGALVNIAQGKGDPVAIACAALELDNE